jgi:TPP-dependent pyruvate/acetoin dehydrogenase alpha subunit
MIEYLKTHATLDLYQKMLRIRLVEEKIAEKYNEQKMRCPVHLSIGQEAVAVGVCAQLNDTDYLLSTHRAHAHYLAKGGSLKAMLAEIYGKSTGCSLGRGGSMHLVDLSCGFLGSTPIVGGSMPVAVGAAFGSYLKQDERITVVFFGEGSTEEGVFSECLNFASLKNLPILFVCENNFYSVYSPLEVRQPNVRNRLAIAKAHGIEGLLGNGNDIEEVYRLAGYALESIRQNKSPFYLEFTTYRHREHCGPNFDNNIGYRSEAEFEYWKKECPLSSYFEKLQVKKAIDVDYHNKMQIEILKEIEEAFDFAESSPFPKPEYDTDHIYAK